MFPCVLPRISTFSSCKRKRERCIWACLAAQGTELVEIAYRFQSPVAVGWIQPVARKRKDRDTRQRVCKSDGKDQNYTGVAALGRTLEMRRP